MAELRIRLRKIRLRTIGGTRGCCRRWKTGEDGFMPGNSVSEDYRGYHIIATGDFCEVLHDKGRIDRFARDYLRMDVPAGLALALLIDEAKERVDAIFSAAERPWRLIERGPRRNKQPAR
jgi:hypothetical protein